MKYILYAVYIRRCGRNFKFLNGIWLVQNSSTAVSACTFFSKWLPIQDGSLDMFIGAWYHLKWGSHYWKGVHAQTSIRYMCCSTDKLCLSIHIFFKMSCLIQDGSIQACLFQCDYFKMAARVGNNAYFFIMPAPMASKLGCYQLKFANNQHNFKNGQKMFKKRTIIKKSPKMFKKSHKITNNLHFYLRKLF